MTSPLSPEAVAQMVADLPSRWKDAAPNPHYRGEELLPIVYADPGSNGWYYRERKPDSVTAYVRVDLITTLAAENATLRADLYDADKSDMSARDMLNDIEAELATLRASEAAAVERVTRLESDNERLRYVIGGCKSAIDTGRNEPLRIWRDQIEIALTLTADKEQNT